MDTNGFGGAAPRARQRRRWIERREAAIRAAARLEPPVTRLEELERRIDAMEAAVLASQRRVLESQDHLARRINELGATLAALHRETRALGARRDGPSRPPAIGQGAGSRDDVAGPGGNPAWTPGTSGPVDYDALVRRVRSLIEATVPPGAQVSVVTRGDATLLELDGRTGRHFPVDDAGRWAGYHPKDSEAAIEHLERLKAAGVGFFVLPQPSYWWLEHYEAFARYLEGRYRLVAHRDTAARIYALDEAAPGVRGQA